MRDYTLYLKDILEAMNDIEIFVEGMSFENRLFLYKSFDM